MLFKISNKKGNGYVECLLKQIRVDKNDIECLRFGAGFV